MLEHFSSVGTQLRSEREGGLAFGWSPDTHMLANDPAGQGVFLSARDCSEMEELFQDLLETAGMLLPMLELAAAQNGRLKTVQLAKEMSARAFLGMKKLLWNWSRLREWSSEEARLRSRSDLFREFQVELQNAVQAGTLKDGSLRATSGEAL